jgi:hypothetical protein
LGVELPKLSKSLNSLPVATAIPPKVSGKESQINTDPVPVKHRFDAVYNLESTDFSFAG